MYTTPTVADFKAKFTRDFPYGTALNKVSNSDIQTGLDDTGYYINEELFCDQPSYNNGYLLLSAHFMVMNLRAAGQFQGLQAQYPWVQSSKGVGSVSESFSIPQRILDNPEFSMLTKTYYGAKFLFIILPEISGQIYTVGGWTRP